MDVFNVMFARMLAFLKEQGVDVSEQRQIQLMERFAYQLTIRKAIYDLYMRPGAPLYGKVFDLKDMIAHGDWINKAKSESALLVYKNAEKHLKSAEKSIETLQIDVDNARAQLEHASMGQVGVLQTQIDKDEKEIKRLSLVASKHYNTMNGAFKELDGSPGIEPFMYCTKQTAIFTFTLMGEMLIDPVTKVILDAVCKFAGLRRKEGDSSEDIFRRDRGNEAPWKRVETPTDELDEQGGRKFNIDYDLNYFEMVGLPKEIAGHVAQLTEPKVSAEECVTYMEGLRRKFIRTHKHQLISKSVVDSLDAHGGAVNRGNFELKKSSESKIISILHYDYKAKKTYVSVAALERYNVDLLQQAILYCLYDGWRDNQTFLLGLPIEGYTEVFNTMNIRKAWGPKVPAVGYNGKFYYKNQPVVDDKGRVRNMEDVVICVDDSNKKIKQMVPMMNKQGEPLVAEIPQTHVIDGEEMPVYDESGKQVVVIKQAYRKITKVCFSRLDEKNKVMYGADRNKIIEYAEMVSEPLLIHENGGLITQYSMGPAFMIPEISYIDDVASELLCRIPWDPDCEVKVYPADKCDRKVAVVKVTEDLDDWGLEKHLLRQGVGGVVLKRIAMQEYIMDFIKAHVKYDADYRSFYHLSLIHI